MKILLKFLLLGLAFASSNAFAKGEGFSLGFNAGISASDQTKINDLISNANSREGGISTSQLGNAWEFNTMLQYRFSGSMIAFQFRPSYFFQGEDGKNSGGDTFEYSLNGFTVFPMFRFYLLENANIKFFTQVGIGWGFVSGTIKEGDASVDFSGHDMGYMGGLGAEFCFTDAHCINIEGNFRFLSVDRLIADNDADFTDTGSNSSINDPIKNGEIEFNNKDVPATLSGIQGFIGYVMYF